MARKNKTEKEGVTLWGNVLAQRQMDLPTGLIFHMDFSYGNTTGRPDKHRNRPDSARIVLCEICEENGKY